jgi:hypothetical protein
LQSNECGWRSGDSRSLARSDWNSHKGSLIFPARRLPPLLHTPSLYLVR